MSVDSASGQLSENNSVFGPTTFVAGLLGFPASLAIFNGGLYFLNQLNAVYGYIIEASLIPVVIYAIAMPALLFLLVRSGRKLWLRRAALGLALGIIGAWPLFLEVPWAIGLLFKSFIF